MKLFVLLFFYSAVPLVAQSTPGYWLIGNYAPTEVRAQTPDLIPWDKYTHVNEFGVSPTKTCAIDASLLRLQIRSFVEAAHRHGKSALVTLKDGDSNVFFYCSSSSNLPRFVNNIVKFVNSHSYDGVDLDWEIVPRWFSGSYISRYESLISELRARMPDKILTMSVYPNADGHALERVAIASHSKLDRVSVMCYDMDGVGKGSAVSWYVDALWTAGDDNEPGCDAVVKAFTSRGLANGQINIGFPFYGRIYPGVTRAGLPRTTLARTTIFYRDLVRNGNLWQARYRRFDQKHGANYLSIPGTNEFVSYGGPEMIDEVVDWVKESGFGGIMTFTTGYEYLPEDVGDRRYPLTTRIYNRLFSAGESHDSLATGLSAP